MRASEGRQAINDSYNDLIVTMQAAWIEWKHGGGAEEAMAWIHNALWGPGLIPDESEAFSKESQAFWDANRSNPWPDCVCGRPSNRSTTAGSFCSEECERKATHA